MPLTLPVCSGSIQLVALLAMTERITVWKAFLDGDCKQIGLSEAFVRDDLEHRNGWYEAANKSRWTIHSEALDVPVIAGRVIVADRWHVELDGSPVNTDLSPDAKAPHVFWRCPFCGKDHITDIDCAEGQQGLWYCERGTKDIALIRWAEPTHSGQQSAH